MEDYTQGENLKTKLGDQVEVSKSGIKFIERIIRFTVCRCRQCKDVCKRLGEPPHILCIYCNNNHTQMVDGRYLGPHNE